MDRVDSSGRILASAWRIVQNNSFLFLVLSLMGAIPGLLASVCLTPGQSSFVSVSGLCLVIPSFIAALLLFALLLQIIASGHQARSFSLNSAWLSVKARFSGFVAANLLVAFYVLLGGIFFVIPGVYLYIRFFFVPYLVLLEGRSVREAFTRNNEMMKGRMGWLARKLLVLLLIAGMSGVFVNSLSDHFAFSQWMRLLFVNAALAVLAPLFAAYSWGLFERVFIKQGESHV